MKIGITASPKALRFISLILFPLMMIAFAQKASAQWGGSGMSGMAGMRRGGGGHNRDTSYESSPATSNSHITNRSPKDFVLTYEQIETSLTQLEEGLKLSHDQLKTWENFAGKVRAYAGDVGKERARLGSELINTSDSLKYLEQATENAKSRYTSLRDVEEAAKPLYKTLNPEQKALFDKKVPTFIAATPKKLNLTQNNYNLPDFGASPNPNKSTDSIQQ